MATNSNQRLANRRLDAVIAEQLFGWQRVKKVGEDAAILVHPALTAEALSDISGEQWEVCPETPLNEAVEWSVPDCSAQFKWIETLAEEMGKRGFWLKLNSPFAPGEQFRPEPEASVERWEETRHHWYASFDFYGTVDTRPLWSGSAENPAEAVARAAVECIEENPEVFKIGG